jgi:hypothetical protein
MARIFDENTRDCSTCSATCSFFATFCPNIKKFYDEQYLFQEFKHYFKLTSSLVFRPRYFLTFSLFYIQSGCIPGNQGEVILTAVPPTVRICTHRYELHFHEKCIYIQTPAITIAVCLDLVTIIIVSSQYTTYCYKRNFFGTQYS